MSLFLGDIDKNILEASEAPDRTCLPTHAPRAFGALDALGLTPWHIAPLAFLCLALVLYKLAESLAFWRHVRRGSHVARVAAAALGELRSEQPTHHRRTRHSWFTASEGQTSVPLLCVACVGHIRPSSADTLQRCAVCGVVAHDGCVRHVGETCRPLATPPGPQQHFWLVSGTSMEEQGPIERISGAASCCIYCSEPVSGELHLGFATEPTWQCACCACYAHVQCFVKAHPHLEGVAGAAKADGEQREGMMKPPETIERLDTCSLGHLGYVLAPVCFLFAISTSMCMHPMKLNFLLLYNAGVWCCRPAVSGPRRPKVRLRPSPRTGHRLPPADQAAQLMALPCTP